LSTKSNVEPYQKYIIVADEAEATASPVSGSIMLKSVWATCDAPDCPSGPCTSSPAMLLSVASHVPCGGWIFSLVPPLLPGAPWLP
jgi:hypothetical protein